jgi:asparagine synthase (glutamine-hydrolysing)
VETVKSDDFDLIDTLARLYDEPYADSSAIPTYRVCQLARKHVTVALSGDGGDETFGGYRRYRMHLMEERMRAALPEGVRRPLFGLLGRLYPKADWAPRMLRAKTTFEGMARTSVEAYFHSMSPDRERPMRSRLFSDSFKRSWRLQRRSRCSSATPRRADTDDPLALIQYIDTHTYLVGDINTKVDRASMAHSLEVREPLMDHELVEWAATLPSDLKLRGTTARPASRRRWSRTCPTTCCTGRRWALRCRWRAGSAARCAARARRAAGRPDADGGWFNPMPCATRRAARIRPARLQHAAVDLLMFDAFLRLDNRLLRTARHENAALFHALPQQHAAFARRVCRDAPA